MCRNLAFAFLREQNFCASSRIRFQALRNLAPAAKVAIPAVAEFNLSSSVWSLIMRPERQCSWLLLDGTVGHIHSQTDVFVCFHVHLWKTVGVGIKLVHVCLFPQKWLDNRIRCIMGACMMANAALRTHALHNLLSPCRVKYSLWQRNSVTDGGLLERRRPVLMLRWHCVQFTDMRTAFSLTYLLSLPCRHSI